MPAAPKISRHVLNKTAREVFSLSGVEELNARIALILKKADKGAGDELKDVYLKAMSHLVNEAKQSVAFNSDNRDPDHVHVRDAIFMAKGDPSKPNVIAGVNSKKAPHWIFLEFGTVKQTARPFLRPAFQATKGLMAAQIIEGLKQFIDDHSE